VVERGVCLYTEKAMNAQRLGAVGVVIGNNVESDSLYLMGYAPDYTGSITIPAVFVSGKSYQLMTQILQSYMFGTDQVQATLEDTTEDSPVGNPNTPPPLTPNPPMDTGVSPPTGTGGGVTDEPEPNEMPEEVDSGMEIVWCLVGVIILFKCMIVTIALRRKCKQNRMARRVGASSSSSSTPLTEGEMSDEGELPVVYATSPPTRGFTVAAPSSSSSVATSASRSSSSASSSRALTATNLSAYPSIQYAPLMPQATAPSDMYDLEKQPIIIRG